MSKKIGELVSEATEFAKEKRFLESADAFKEAFAILPADPGALRELASVMVDLGETETGLSLLADSVDPEKPEMETLRRIATLLRGKNRLNEAGDFLICALAQDLKNEELFAETLGLLKELGREGELFAEDASTS